ncbi:zinc transporter ZntB [Cysteiniphilum halobium]|uniref:zinc transporter ZntB n=1 Tax=Cysteiniphilum halobium TaxID=2219059 RepID=UPI000E64B256|nr:zinc transporter ZntB [Cysteiniphilum halobium]
MEVQKKHVNIKLLDGNGSAKEITEKDISTALAVPSGIVWLHLDLTQAADFLNEYQIIPEKIINMLCAHETRPRILVLDNGMLATFRAINLNKGQKPEDMTSIRMWLTERLIITVKRRDMHSITEINNMFRLNAGPCATSEFLNILLMHITEHTDQLLDSYDGKLDDIELAIKKDRSIVLSDKVNAICKKAIKIRRYILPQREAILAISGNKLSWLSDEDVFELKQVLDANMRLLEDLDAMKDRSLIIQNEIHAYEQTQMNQRMYILSMISVVFIPLGFITGLLGINVAGIPGAQSHYGFIIVCVILALIMVGYIAIMRKIRWI